jgi:hypothetical protein
MNLAVYRSFRMKTMALKVSIGSSGQLAVSVRDVEKNMAFSASYRETPWCNGFQGFSVQFSVSHA